LLNPIESSVESLLLAFKSLFEVLNKLLIHAASAVKLNGKAFRLSCQ